jgi:ABC-type Fe3+/spermidine/putrescine transport system ATPase subunit
VRTTLQLRDLVVAGVPGRARVRVSLTLAAAELVAVVVGGTGDGYDRGTDGRQTATALARTVVGLAKPLSGRIMVGDRDVTDLPPALRQTGYVPAGGALLPHLTMQQNIEYLLRRRETVRGLTRNWKSMLIGQLELGPLLDLRPHELSAEQRVRASVARAMLSLPEVLVLDVRTAPATWSLRELLERVQIPETAGPSAVVFTADAAMSDQVARAVAVERTVATGEPAAVVRR